MDLQKSFDTLELEAFYAEQKSCIWVIMIVYSFNSKPTEVIFATGFSIDSKGLVLTCSHIFKKLNRAICTKIHMRRLGDDNFPFEADLVYHRPKWDLALLQVKNVSDCCFGRFAADDDENIFAGETLLHIGHPANFVGSFLIGRAVYPCLNVAIPTGSPTCGQYKSTALQLTPPFRVMGDVWNSEIFAKYPKSKFDYEKNLHPLIPIIQISSLVSGGGCSGGPVFNTRGEIVGLIVLGSDGYDIAIHVAMLKHFIKENIPDGNMKRDEILDDDKVGSWKRVKRLAFD